MLLLIADSVCGGFGQRDKKSFIHKAAENLGITIWDESATGMSSSAYLEFLHSGTPLCPEQQPPLSDLAKVKVAVIAIGNVDGKKTFKQKNFLGLIVPPRYRKEKIDPRPYYSSRRWKRYIEKTENILRHAFRWYCHLTGNLQEYVSTKSTQENISKILERLYEKTVILISTSTTNNFYFPGAQKNYFITNKFLKEKTKNKEIVFYDMQSKINQDHLLADKFHLNSHGHDFLERDFRNLLAEIYKAK